MPNVKLIVYRRYEYAATSLTTTARVQNNEPRLFHIYFISLPSFEKNAQLTQPFKVFKGFIKYPSVGAKLSHYAAVLKLCLLFALVTNIRTTCAFRR